MEHYRGIAIPTTLEQVCEPQRMALLVYDMQVGVLNQIDDAAEVITRVTTVLDAARSARGTDVFHPAHDAAARGDRYLRAAHRDGLAARQHGR
jgi:biuret amidohydrolase